MISAKLDRNISSDIGDNDITLFSVLEIWETSLVNKCPCLPVSPGHTGVHSFIYMYRIFQKNKEISEDSPCLYYFSTQLLLW